MLIAVVVLFAASVMLMSIAAALLIIGIFFWYELLEDIGVICYAVSLICMSAGSVALLLFVCVTLGFFD